MINTLLGNITSVFGYYNTNNNNSTYKELTPFDVKLLMMNIMNKITLYKNQKTNFIKEKLQIVINNLKQNNVNIASVNMSTVLSQEDLIEVYKLLIVSSSLLIEKHEVFAKNKECPKELEKHLKRLIYASQHLLIEEGTNFRELMKYKYGSSFVENALENKNYCIDHQIVNAFQLKPKNDLIIISRLKELAYRYNINCDFPPDDLINHINFECIEVDNVKPYCMKNSELFEKFAKDNVNKNDFIINKELELDNGIVLVESKFDIDKLNNYCNTKNIHIRNVDNQFEIIPNELKKTEQTMIMMNNYNNNNLQNTEKQLLNSNNNANKTYLLSEESKNEISEYIKNKERKFRYENMKNKNIEEENKSNTENEEHKENITDDIDTQIK